MKKVIAAAIVRVLEFDSIQEMYVYIGKLCERKQIYKVISHQEQKDGKIWLRIATSYNSSPLIEEVGIDWREI